MRDNQEQDYIAKSLAYQQIIGALESYFELTQEPDEDGTINDNLEWDRGFQAAIAIAKGVAK